MDHFRLEKFLSDILQDRPDNEKPRALVVDDTEAIRFMLETALSVGGWEIRAAANGMDALEMIDKGNFDLVIMDIGLPDINGLDLVEILHKEQPRLPIVMLTAQDDAETKVRALVAGASDYITKPFRVEDVLEAMNLILEQRQMNRKRAANG